MRNLTSVEHVPNASLLQELFGEQVDKSNMMILKRIRDRDLASEVDSSRKRQLHSCKKNIRYLVLESSKEIQGSYYVQWILTMKP